MKTLLLPTRGSIICASTLRTEITASNLRKSVFSSNGMHILIEIASTFSFSLPEYYLGVFTWLFYLMKNREALPENVH